MDETIVPCAREPQPFVIQDGELDYVAFEDFFTAVGGRAVLAIVRTVDAVDGPPTHEKLLTFRRIVGLTGVRNDQGIGPDYRKLLKTLGERDPRFKARGFIVTHTATHGKLSGRQFSLNPETNQMKVKQRVSVSLPDKIPVGRMLIFRVPNPV